MIDSVEGPREIDGHRHRPEWWAMLIETRCHLMDEREQRCGGRATGPKTMLVVIKVKVRGYVPENKLLKHLGCGTEEGDWSV